MEIHASQISTFKACPRMYKYQYVDGLVPKATSPKLFLGTGFHAGVAAHYRGQDAAQAYETWADMELARLQEYDLDPEYMQKLYDEVELGRKMLAAYLAFAKREDNFAPLSLNGELAVEQRFEVPLLTPRGDVVDDACLAGTFDGVVRDVYSHAWLMEHKTAKQFPTETDLRLNEQAGYYLLAASMLFPNEFLVGVVYNVTRKTDPATAKTPVVKRWKVVKSPQEIQGLQKRLYYAYKDIQRCLESQIFMPSPGQHCNWRCAYTQLCVAEEDGSDVSQLIDGLYTRREENSPEELLEGEVA